MILWPPAAVPTARVVSVAGAASPADTKASLGLGVTDIAVPLTPSGQILVETTGIAPTGTVQVRIAPKYGEPSFVATQFSSGDQTQATWMADAVLPAGVFAVQALAENPAQ